MGQTLSEPVVDKHTAAAEDERLAWAVSEMQGWRLSMEDAHAHVLQLGDKSADDKATSFFAVYDGHGGSSVAKFAGDTVHERLAASDLYKKRDWAASLKRAFLATDEDLRANPDFRGDPSGCTAVAVLIDDEYKTICANSGDSRAVKSVEGRAFPLSQDHKPTNKGENSRIVAAGGFVEFGRVNGNLALSRALGDFEFKQNASLDAEHQIVTADPDIIAHADPEDEFVVIACDGIWDVFSSQQVIDFVRRALADRKELSAICEELLDRCLAPDSDWGGVGCDNMTAMVVLLKKGKTMDEYYDWIKARVESGKGYETPADIADPFANGPRGGMAGRAGGGAVPGTLSMALGQRMGSDEDDEDDEGEEFDLPSLQAALRGQGLHVTSFGEDDDDVDMDDDESEGTTAKIEDIGDSDEAASKSSAANEVDEADPALTVNGTPSAIKTSMEPPSSA